MSEDRINMLALYWPWFIMAVAAVGFALFLRNARIHGAAPCQPIQRRRVPMPWEVYPAPSEPPEPLPPAGSTTFCRKCGAVFPEHLTVRWRPYCSHFVYLPPSPNRDRQRWSWEHLECRCLRCGYVWAEAPEKTDPAGGGR